MAMTNYFHATKKLLGFCLVLILFPLADIADAGNLNPEIRRHSIGLPWYTEEWAGGRSTDG